MAADAERLRCEFRSRAITAMGTPVFRRSAADGLPVMVVRLGDRDAAFPLGALRRSLDIPIESDDGRMLALIAESLTFVSSLELGEALPQEVLNGQASWSADAQHRRIAAARLRLRLIEWLRGVPPDASVLVSADAADLPRLAMAAHDPAHLEQALSKGALALGLPNGTGVELLLDELSHELAYIEALRERLMLPMRDLVLRLMGLTRGDGVTADTLTQVQRLAGKGVAQIDERFVELDAQTEDVIAALGELGAQRVFIRASRDFLYGSQRAWSPLFEGWADPEQTAPARLPALLARTYRFLAPRFMPTRDWLQARRSTNASAPAMVW